MISSVFLLGEAFFVSSTPSHSPGPERGHHCSHQFCIDNEYEKLELPPPGNKSRVVEVIITPHILEIFEVIIYKAKQGMGGSKLS